MPKAHDLTIGFVLAALLTTAWEPALSAPPPPTAAPSTSTSAPVARSTLAPSDGKLIGGTGQVIGTVVRFSAGSISVDVTVDEDNSAVRDFLSMLPLTLKLEEFVGREKISYLPRKLDLKRAPGSDPEDGDLIYYIPWGNIGFYYNAAGIGYSDKTIHLGTYKASPNQLKQLEGRPVAVEVAR